MANKKLEVNVQHIIKDIEAGKFTSFQSILNETGGQHVYEAVNEELRKYLKENNAVMISATQLAHLRETGYKDFESERKALEIQLKTATGELKKQIESKLKDLNKFQYYSERKAPIGDELHKILELTDKGLVDLNDAVKAANQIMQQMQVDPQTSEKLKSLVGKTSTDTMKNFRRAIKNAQDFQKMKISAGMVGGETETARSMAFKKDGKLYVVSGSTDWTKAKEGKIGDYKTTASFSAMHNLIQSVVNATLIRAQEGENLPITSKVAHLPITAGRMKYANTLPGVYDINVGSYQEGVKLISDLVDVLEGKKDFTSVRIPGSVQGRVEKGQFVHKDEIKEATYYNGKPIGQWVGQTVEEVKSLLDSLAPQQRQQFLGTLFGQTDGKPWYNTENAKTLKEAFRNIYQPVQKDFKTYGGMSLSTLSSKFASGEITKEALINAIKEGIKTQTDTEELASRLFFGEDKYYSEAFVKAIKEAIPEISSKISDIFDRELDKTTAGYLSGLSEDEKPKPSKYDMYAPDVWELEEKKQQAWIESGVERMKLGYTDKPLFDDKGIKTLADRMTRLVDFYQRTTNIFSKVAEDINKDLPADTQPYTGEELARTYLARKSPEVYDRYMRSKGLYEGFTSQAQGLPLEDQVQWIRKQLDTFIAEEGNLLNTFDTFTEIADQKSKDVFSKEFARKISYVGAPGGYVAPGTLYGLLMGSTFGVSQEGQMPEFDKLRGKDVYGRTLSDETIDKLAESQVDNDISKIDFYKQKLSEIAEKFGVSSEKIKIFSDYLDRVQKVADQAGIELEQVLEGIDEKGFIKEGSLLDKQLRAIDEMPVESLYLPTSGKHGIGGKARESLFGLFDDTSMESLATQYDIYLDEQDSKRKEELKKQNDIRVQKEQEFTKLIDTELENRLKFLYAETAKPDYIKAQEAAERNEDTMGLSPEMFKEISGEGQRGLSIGSVTGKAVEETEKVNEANEQLAETIKEETESKRQSIEQIKASESIQDVRKRGKIDNDYDKWTVDRVVKNELGEVTDTIYKKARKSSGSRGPSGISQVVEKVIPAVENINNNIDEINKKIPGSFKDIDWESFQKMYDKMEVSSDGGAGGGDGGGKTPPKSSGRKGKSDEEKAQADTEKRQKQDIREYQQYINRVINLESQIDKLQRQATLSGGKHKDAIYGTIDALNEELGDLNRNNDALKQRVATEQAATKESIDATAALKKQSNAQKNLVSVKGATSIWDMMANDIRRATMRIADFGIAAKVLNKIPQDIQKVIQYTKELDAAMTNIRVVTGASAEEAQTLAQGYTQLAKELGITTVEVANSANEWARQGYEAEQANQLIVASSKLAKLGMISTTEATKDLTSAIKGFKLSTEEAMSVVDKLTKIDQVAAISAGNLAEGLARVSTTAQQAGLSLDETAAMVTTITEVTQRDASTAGEALRTLISRYSNVKAGVFTSMGEEAEETSENINDIEKVLGKLGIRIRTSGTEMRSIEDVLDELAEKWDTLDDVSRNAVASAFAGVRQRESFNILLSNWDRVKELTEESANAAGTADEKYTAYMDSMEAATKRLQNAWEGFTQSLETSTVMKFLTNAIAAMVENADKLKYIITYITAVSSARIFDFVTNKGETGGFKGLIANIPFIGRGTKTNNILESIDKKVGNIEKGVGADSLANQTRNGGFFKGLGSFLKTGFGRGDIYDPETGESVSYKDLKLAKKLGINVQNSAEYEKYSKLLKQRQIGNTTMGAASAVLTNLLTTKQVGGDVGGSFMKKLMGMEDNEQVIEETAGDKIGRTISSGILAGLGGYFLGPLGAMLGQTLGEGFASMFSTWFHRDELAMKQRVADAKENLSALGDIKSAIENNEDLLSRDSYTSKDLEKLKLYVDSLRKSFADNDDLAKSFLDDVNNLRIGTFTTIEDILSQIANGNADINKQLKRQLELTTARLTVENTLSEQEEDRKKIQEYVGKIYNQFGIKHNTDDTYYGRSKLLDFYTREDIANLLNTETYASGKIDYIQIKGKNIDEVFQNAQKILEEVRKEYSETNKNLVSEWETIVDNLSKQLDNQKKLNAELLSTQVDYAYLTSDILNTKSRDEIRELGMEGVVKIIRDELIAQGVGVVDKNGVIHQDAYDAIVKKVRSDSTLSDYISKDIRSIGELISKNDVQGIEAFARAFGLTTEAAKELGKQFGYLTQSMGLMNIQETTEYYDKLSTVFSNLSSHVALTAEQINSLLTTSELKDLLPYLMNQDDPDALIKELYKRIYGGGQDVHMENALYDATMGMSTDKFREYLQNKGLKDYVDEIDKGGYTTLSQIRDAVKEFDETDPRRQAFLEYLETINYTYSKDLAALEKPSEYIKSQLEEQINNLQEQKDALSQINDEREKELNLIKAKRALEDARKEKKRVYRAGVGFSYESNDEAIAEARKNLENLNTQKRQEDLQAQIDALQMQKDIIEALPNRAQLEQTKKIWELWAADKGVKGSLASVTEGVTMLADAYTNATNQMNMRAKTEGVLNTPDERDGMQTSNENTNPTVTLSETQIEYAKTLVSDLEDIKNFLLYGAKSKNFQEMMDFVNENGLLQGDYYRWGQAFSFLGVLDKWKSLTEEEREVIRKQAKTRAVGDTYFQGGAALINELGTEAVITPGGTLTALPSKTGIVPADITRNVWALGEVAPTLVAQLSSLNQKAFTGNAGNTTYEEGQYFDNFTMNVYPAKGDDFNKILEQARAQMRLTRHNN